MLCPACHEDKLAPSEYENVATRLCAGCGGRWVSPEALKAIIGNRKMPFSDAARKQAARKLSQPGVPAAESQRTLQCPECQHPLEARNYAVDTGIIINRCPKGHGVWLDRSELEAIQMLHEGTDDSLRR